MYKCATVFLSAKSYFKYEATKKNIYIGCNSVDYNKNKTTITNGVFKECLRHSAEHCKIMIYSGTPSPVHHTTFMKALDDSMETFLNQKQK